MAAQRQQCQRIAIEPLELIVPTTRGLREVIKLTSLFLTMMILNSAGARVVHFAIWVLILSSFFWMVPGSDFRGGNGGSPNMEIGHFFNAVF